MIISGDFGIKSKSLVCVFFGYGLSAFVVLVSVGCCKIAGKLFPGLGFCFFY